MRHQSCRILSNTPKPKTYSYETTRFRDDTPRRVCYPAFRLLFGFGPGARFRRFGNQLFPDHRENPAGKTVSPPGQALLRSGRRDMVPGIPAERHHAHGQQPEQLHIRGTDRPRRFGAATVQIQARLAGIPGKHPAAGRPAGRRVLPEGIHQLDAEYRSGIFLPTRPANRQFHRHRYPFGSDRTPGAGQRRHPAYPLFQRCGRRAFRNQSIVRRIGQRPENRNGAANDRRQGSPDRSKPETLAGQHAHRRQIRRRNAGLFEYVQHQQCSGKRIRRIVFPRRGQSAERHNPARSFQSAGRDWILPTGNRFRNERPGRHANVVRHRTRRHGYADADSGSRAAIHRRNPVGERHRQTFSAARST